MGITFTTRSHTQFCAIKHRIQKQKQKRNTQQSHYPLWLSKFDVQGWLKLYNINSYITLDPIKVYEFAALKAFWK